MKVLKITLADAEFIEVDDEYQIQYTNEKTYPAFLTNYALKKGKEMGLLDTSLASELISWGQAGDKDLGERFDEDKMLAIIYLAILGANRNFELTYEEFLDRYHYSLFDTMEIYNELLNSIAEQRNNFAEGFRRSTAVSKKK